MPFQRIGSRQAVIAGQRQRVLDHGDGVVGHRQLDDVGFDGARAGQPSSKSPAKLSIRRALTASRASMPPSDLLRARQASPAARRDWTARGPSESRSASRARRGRRRHRSRRRRSRGPSPGVKSGARHSSGLRTSISWSSGNTTSSKIDVMAAAGAQAEMIPGLDDPRARQARRNQKQADARLGFVGLGPDRIPFQDRRAGRIDLAAGQPPSGLGPPRDRRGQPAARRRSQIRLDAQRVDQRHAFDRLAGQLARQPARPARAARHHQMLDVVHRQHQRGRWIGLADDAEDARRLRWRPRRRRPSAAGTVSASSPASDKSSKFSNGKLAVAIMRRCPRRESPWQGKQARVDAGGLILPTAALCVADVARRVTMWRPIRAGRGSACAGPPDRDRRDGADRAGRPRCRP